MAEHTIVEYIPEDAECSVCGNSPCVIARPIDGGEPDMQMNMCGPCTFGTADALDPDWWNNQDD